MNKPELNCKTTECVENTGSMKIGRLKKDDIPSKNALTDSMFDKLLKMINSVRVNSSPQPV